MAKLQLNQLTCRDQLDFSEIPRKFDPQSQKPVFHQHLDHFLQGKCFQNQQEAEDTFQDFIESQSMDFYATGISKLISHWQQCVDCNCSYFN